MSKNKFTFIDQEDEIIESYDSNNRPPRFRYKFTKIEEDFLENFYQINPYPNKMDRIGINISIKTPVKNIKIWFQNRRTKDKHKENNIPLGI